MRRVRWFWPGRYRRMRRKLPKRPQPRRNLRQLHPRGGRFSAVQSGPHLGCHNPDFDNDGLEDVMGYVNNQPQSLELHLSQGGSTFQDASTQLGSPGGYAAQLQGRNGHQQRRLARCCSRADLRARPRTTRYLHVVHEHGLRIRTPHQWRRFGLRRNIGSGRWYQAYTVDYSNDGIPDWIFKVSSNAGAGIMSVLGTLETDCNRGWSTNLKYWYHWRPGSFVLTIHGR